MSKLAIWAWLVALCLHDDSPPHKNSSQPWLYCKQDEAGLGTILKTMMAQYVYTHANVYPLHNV